MVFSSDIPIKTKLRKLVLPELPELDGYHLITPDMNVPGSKILKIKSNQPMFLDFISGMPILIVYHEDGKDAEFMYYNNRAVEIPPNTFFATDYLGGYCNVQYYCKDGSEVIYEIDNKPKSYELTSDMLLFGKTYSLSYQKPQMPFFFRGEKHEPFELVYIIYGSMHHVVNGKHIPLSQGELTIVGRNDWHMQYSDSNVCFITLAFSLQYDICSFCNKRIRANSFVAEKIADIVKEHSIQDDFSEERITSMLKSVLIELIRKSEEMIVYAENQQELPKTLREENKILDKAMQYIAENSRKTITLSELSSTVHVSIPYLSKIFSTNLSMSPGQYISMVRIEDCKCALKDGSLSITETAQKYGFSSVQQFSRQFHRIVGLSPTEFLRTQKG